MHIASLEAHTTLNTYTIWKLALRAHLNTDVRTRDRTWNFSARPQPDMTSGSIVRSLNRFISRRSCPDDVVSDRDDGKNFVAEETKSC